MRWINRAAVPWIASLAICLWIGCSGEAPPQSPARGGAGAVEAGVAESGRTTASESPTVVSPPVRSAEPRVVDVDQYGEELKRHVGRVVLVDFWATWCGPCKEQFPHSNDLAKKLAARGFQVVSVSFDDSDQMAAVTEFLKGHPGPMTHLVSSYGAGVESFDAFAIEGGAVPYYKLYDRTGKLRYQLCGNPEGVAGVIDIDQLDDKIDELLNEKSE